MLKSFLLLSKNVVFAFIIFKFLKNLKTDSRLQIFRAMRQFIFIAEILDFFFNNMRELRESDRQQLSHCFERNALFNKLLFSSEQLIIKSSFENEIKKNMNDNVIKYEREL